MRPRPVDQWFACGVLPRAAGGKCVCVLVLPFLAVGVSCAAGAIVFITYDCPTGLAALRDRGTLLCNHLVRPGRSGRASHEHL